MKKLHKQILKIFFFIIAFISNTALSKNIIKAIPVPPGPADPSLYGKIEKPPGVDKYGDMAITVFINNLITLATIVAGIWTLINLILAGWIYITEADNSSAHQKVTSKIINSAIGLTIIAISYLIIGLLGLVLFGEASFFLSPTFEGV